MKKVMVTNCMTLLLPQNYMSKSSQALTTADSKITKLNIMEDLIPMLVYSSLTICS